MNKNATRTPVDVLILSGDNGFSETRINQGHRARGAAKIAHSIRNLGYSAQVINKIQLFDTDQLILICSQYIGEKTVIGISTTMMIGPGNAQDAVSSASEQRSKLFAHQSDFMKKLKTTIDFFRSKFKNRVLIGGSDAESFAEYFSADLFINGYAENSIGKILDSWLNNGIQKKLNTPWDIQSCNFKWDLSECVVPGEVLPIETSRGCIFSCKFCGYEMIGKKKGTYERSLKLIKEEIIDNYNKFGVDHYVLLDDTFNDSDLRVNQWCDMVESLPFKIYYSGYFRLDLLHRFQNTAKRLYKTGLIGVALGIESFHPDATKSIGKSFNGRSGKDFLPFLWESIFEKKVLIHATMIVGLPHETVNDLIDTLKFFKNNSYICPYFSGLMIVNQDKKIRPRLASEFSLNATDYGYIFTDQSDHTAWKNSVMTNVEAAQLADKLNNIIRKTNCVIDSWTYPSLHKSGYTLEQILSWKDNKQLEDIFSECYDTVNRAYVDQLSEYSGVQIQYRPKFK